MPDNEEIQRFALGADRLLNRATPDQLKEAVELLAFKYSYFVHRYGEMCLNDLQALAKTDPLGPEMQAIHLESDRTIVSALSTLMGIGNEEPTRH